MKAEVPTIVASIQSLNQTGAFSATLFTPSSSGLFRISEYLEASPATPFTVPVMYTDDLGSQTVGGSGQFQSVDPINNVAAAGFSVLVRVKAGQPITSATGGPPAGVTYNVYYVVEDMN